MWSLYLVMFKVKVHLSRPAFGRPGCNVSNLSCSRIVLIFLKNISCRASRGTATSLLTPSVSPSLLVSSSFDHLRFRHQLWYIYAPRSPQPAFLVRFALPISHNATAERIPSPGGPVSRTRAAFPLHMLSVVLRRRLISKRVLLLPILFPRLRLLRVSPLHAISYIFLRHRAILLLRRLIRFRPHML